MRRNNKLKRFFQQRQYEIASVVLFLSVAVMSGVYITNRITNQNRQSEIARERISEEADLAELEDLQTTEDPEEEVSSVTSIIQPEKEEPAQKKISDSDKEQAEEEKETVAEAESEENEENACKVQETNSTQVSTEKELHFSPEKDLTWPLQGDVILSYSMDQTVYFATLDQYKYNPAIIIAGKVNAPVNAAATGRITSIETNEETGLTVTMDLGDGYQAVYGQLKEIMYKEGAVVEAGNAIGYIAEPTKYYSVEGSNLYFELLKDETPVDPLQYMQ